MSSDQTRLFSWDNQGYLKIWLKDGDKLTYQQTITIYVNEWAIDYS